MFTFPRSSRYQGHASGHSPRDTIGAWLVFAAALTGCSSSDDPAASDAAAALRPGVEDSSQVYRGTPSAHESAFWVAVRNADDTARAAAVQDLIADVARDPSNGYSEFLIGASYFMPPRAALTALAAGTAPAPFQPAIDAQPYLQQGVSHLTDPLYLGFDGALLSAFLFASGDPQAGATWAAAVMHNPVATGFNRVVQDLARQAPAQGLTDIYTLLEYCSGGALDHTDADAAHLVAKLNAGQLRHRECYSGYHAPHGSSGLLLIVGDLQALNGNQHAALAYYRAVRDTSDYASWPLAPVVERRLAGGGAAPNAGEAASIAATCGTCHVESLR
jgi:hypothetical protein